jgi:uncharacterized protein (UPF0371 family)
MNPEDAIRNLSVESIEEEISRMTAYNRDVEQIALFKKVLEEVKNDTESNS